MIENRAPFSDVTLSTLLNIFGSYLLKGVYTALPGVIESYDADSCKATVMPAVLEKAGDGEVMPNKPISSVPVVWPGSAKGFIRFPLTSGDGVLLIFSCRSADEWKGNGSIVAPSDNRTHHLTDCIAIPGLLPFGKVQAQNLALTALNLDKDSLNIVFGTTFISISKTGEIAVGNNVKVTATGDVEVGAINPASGVIVYGLSGTPPTVPTKYRITVVNGVVTGAPV